jgi:hypothetical protein
MSGNDFFPEACILNKTGSFEPAGLHAEAVRYIYGSAAATIAMVLSGLFQ